MNLLNRKKYRIMNLSNGDTLIGEILLKSSSAITVYRPYSLKILTMMDSFEENDNESIIRQEMLILKNWLDMSKTNKAEIRLNHVLSITEPTDRVCDFYDAEKEKEDNPELIEKIMKKLKEEKDIEFNNGDEELNFDYTTNNLTNFIDDIILGNLSTIDDEEYNKEESKKESKKDSKETGPENDTDTEMYGW
tara:strand:+ start:60 stop:635 length:576 start_codon:yes stop_codon:yes gene_type:complete